MTASTTGLSAGPSEPGVRALRSIVTSGTGGGTTRLGSAAGAGAGSCAGDDCMGDGPVMPQLSGPVGPSAAAGSGLGSGLGAEVSTGIGTGGASTGGAIGAGALSGSACRAEGLPASGRVRHGTLSMRTFLSSTGALTGGMRSEGAAPAYSSEGGSVMSA